MQVCGQQLPWRGLGRSGQLAIRPPHESGTVMRGYRVLSGVGVVSEESHQATEDVIMKKWRAVELESTLAAMWVKRAALKPCLPDKHAK